ncbi:hypothetical protein TRV_05909 [Trichophyton verrucosum HKI 0517]|uniref:F-box domain-containing protein n=1 Tax=Trichophyton verrucosum (strain HKI 0517) TaxID=663202 RepID=D4DFF9_TRIVH|nr:uncharacterized protein TRV_05909 [Trichophyton verrucosum HKI 0517]EFE39421.1 hypothetical protein TRV_05909 [Trichophyton verrucosum HKI 0517]
MSPATIDSLPYEIITSVLSYIPVVEYNNIKLAGSRHLVRAIRGWASRISYQKYVELLQQQDTEGCGLPSGTVRTALAITIDQGHEFIVRRYINRYGGAKTRPVSRENRTFVPAFHIAAFHGSAAILRLLMDRRNMRCQRTGATALHMAAKGGSLEAIKLLIENGADINAIDFDEYTPLRLAWLADAQEDVMRYLEEQGGCRDATEVLKKYPSRKFADLLWSCTDEPALIANVGPDIIPYRDRRRKDVIRSFGRYLIAKRNEGSASSQQYQSHLIATAVARQVHEVVGALIDDGFPVDSWISSAGQNLLHKAVLHNNAALAELLAKNGVNPSHVALGLSPFHHAATLGHLRSLQGIIDAGFSANMTDHDGRTALHCASHGCENFVSILVDKNGADIEARDNAGRTPLHASVLAENEAIFLDLLDRGADINARDNNQNTPLILACKQRAYIYFHELLRRGADITLFNADGRNAMEVSPRLSVLKDIMRLGVDPQLIAKAATVRHIRQTKVDDADDEIPQYINDWD